MKIRTDGRRILVLFLILFLFSFAVCVKDAVCEVQKSFLWKVRSDNNTVYVLGSLHLMRPQDYPLNKSIEDAFNKSDVLSVEANINDITQLDLEKLLQKALYPENETIEDHVSRETYETIKGEIERLGLPLMLVQRQRPWFLALSLTSMELLNLGFDPSYGIDMHFLSLARGKKKIVELESLDYQFNLLSNFSDDEQEAFLRYSLREMHVLRKEMESLIDAWKKGDAQALESIMAESTSGDSDMSPLLDKLITERNRNMVGKIEGYLEEDKPCFVIIGAGHLVGSEGIISLLKERGYKVEQM